MELDDFTTPGTGFEVLPCPTKLPHDLQVSQKLARWFGPPYNSWYVGSIAEVNKRRTKMENVSVEFKDYTYGVTAPDARHFRGRGRHLRRGQALGGAQAHPDRTRRGRG